MNEATWIIIIGLGLDIVGAVLIIGPLRHRSAVKKRLEETLKEILEYLTKSKQGKIDEVSPQNNKKDIDRLSKIVYDRQLEELSGLKKFSWGITILILGFILQIIGNWMLNPPI